MAGAAHDRAVMRRVRRGGGVRAGARIVALALLMPLGLYLIAAALLARIPVNDGWTQPDDGIAIFVQSNGVHTGIVMPDGPGRWRAYGWGDRTFYLETPRWQDLRPASALAALAGSGATVMHVERLGDFAADDYWRRLVLRPAEFRRLHAFVAATLAPGGAVQGYGANDAFYPARGRYSALVTCNVWTGRALAAAGVRVGRWTPFADDVMRWIPATAQ